MLENNVPTALPIYVTNVTDLDIHYWKLTSSSFTGELLSHQAIDRVWDIAYATPAKVRDLLGGEAGVVVGSFVPRPTPFGEVSDPDDADDRCASSRVQRHLS